MIYSLYKNCQDFSVFDHLQRNCLMFYLKNTFQINVKINFKIIFVNVYKMTTLFEFLNESYI